MRKIYGYEPHAVQPHRRGQQIVYHFDNGYGASILPDTYPDQKEVCVLRRNEHGVWVTVGKTPAVLDVARMIDREIPDLLWEITQLTDERVAAYRERYFPEGSDEENES